jgi:hypothetical protein
MSRDNQDTLPRKTDYTGCVIAPMLLPIYLIFHYYGENTRGMIVYSLVGVFALILYRKREIMFELYFAIPVILIFCIELFISLVARMPKEMSYGAAIIPFAVCYEENIRK